MGNIFILDMSRGWFINLVRSFFMLIDCLVYSIVRTFFKIIFQLSNFELTGFYEIFEERVYVILGIFMLFKVTISLITYLVNPDKINDKEQGAGKLITRIITVLVMLIALPTFFSLLTEAQNKLLPVIPRIIIGTTNTLSTDDAAGVANNMSLTMLQGFAHAKTEDGCGTSLNLHDHWDLLGVINDPCENNEDIYKYDYFPGISTIAGILMLYVLFSLCITIAIRAFKLIILRMLAPIPVISYIDPKSSKDGAFKSWSKMLISTWAELFMYIGIIYFIIYMVDFLLFGEAWKGFFNSVDNGIEGALLLAFIIVGLLFFAKQAPKFAFDALGIKNTGSFTRMLGMGAAALGMGGSAKSTFSTLQDKDEQAGTGKHTLKNLGRSLFSGASSGVKAGSALLSTDKPTLATGIDAIDKYNSLNLSRINAGSTSLGRLEATAQRLFNGQTDYERMEKQRVATEDANKKLLQYKNTLEKKALEKDDLFIHFESNGKTYGGEQGINYMEFMAHTEGAKNGNKDSLQWFIDHGFSRLESVPKEIEEEYPAQVGSKRVWNPESHVYDDVPVYETRTRKVTKTVTQEVADWQSAQSFVDKIKDMQTQLHAKRVDAAAKRYEETKGTNYEDATVFEKYGTEYNDYRLAKDATNDINLNIDFTTYARKDANETHIYGIKQGLGETNKITTGIVTDPKYKAAKGNADATKKN